MLENMVFGNQILKYHVWLRCSGKSLKNFKQVMIESEFCFRQFTVESVWMRDKD